MAACVCLFALDKHEAIPVDTHVWQLATRYYLPSLKGEQPRSGTPAARALQAWQAATRQAGVCRQACAQISARGYSVSALCWMRPAAALAADVCGVSPSTKDATRCAGKTLTPKVMVQVEKAFQDVFGPYAGWAHNVLFVSELASQRHRLPGTKPEAQAKWAPADACTCLPCCTAPSSALRGHVLCRARRKAKQPAPALEGREILQLETEGSPGAAGAVPRKRRTRRKTAAER